VSILPRTHVLSVLFVLGLFVSDVAAQAPDGYEINVIAVSSTTTDELAGLKIPIWGLGVAGAVEWQVARPFSAIPQIELSVMPKLEYAPRGVRQSFSDLDATGSHFVDAGTRLHYLSIPVFAKARYSFDESPLALYVMGGPRFDLMIESESGTFDFADGRLSSNLDERYERATLGLSGGIGLQIAVSERIAFTLEVRRHRDVTTPVDEGGTSPVDRTAGTMRNLATDYSFGVKWK
jgi:hypothetical protein